MKSWAPRGVVFRPDFSISWMGGGLGAFFPLVSDDGTVRLFLTGRDESVRSRIGVATFQWTESPKLISITPDPVFDLGEPGCFDMDGVSYPWIVERDGELWMYYVGWNRLGSDIPFRNQIGLAISKDGGKTFVRATRAPLLPMTDEEPLGNGSICVERVPDGWRMFYTNFLRWERRADGPRHYYHIREAYSRDGIYWERPGKVIVDLIPPDEYALGAPDLDIVDGTRYIYFTARGHRYRLFASIEGPPDTWTRLPAPIELARSDFDSEMQCYPRLMRLPTASYLLYAGNGYGRAGIGYAERVDGPGAENE
jgi:hypothetical protein